MENKSIAIGVDVGGTSIKGAAISRDGKVLDVFSLPIRKVGEQNQTMKELVDLINHYLVDHNLSKDNVLGIGLGVPGAIDVDKGIILSSNNLKWNDLHIKDIISQGTGLPAKIMNDANAATLGEARFGAGKNYKDFIMLTLGTGVGGGIVIDHKLYTGNKDKAAELGHNVVVIDGEQCSCGRRGCLEAYASATALIRDTKRMMEAHKDSLMWKDEKVDGATAFKYAKLGDEYAQEVVDNYIKYLGEGLLNFFNTFRPEAVILSGGISKEGEYLTSRLYKYCKERQFGFRCTPSVEIIVSELGYDAGKVGAASMFFE